MRDTIGRRHTLTLGLFTAAASSRLGLAPAAAQDTGSAEGKTYVLVHGAWGGGWFWTPVAERLRAQGHRVVTPTLTGMGERKHLLSRGVTLDTWVEDLVNAIEADELRDAILVGYSFGGIPAIGVVDRIPERIRRLVLLDSLVVEGGQRALDVVPADRAEGIRRAAVDQGSGPVLPPPRTAAALGMPDGPITQWLLRRFTPQPLATYESPLRLDHPVGNGRPRTYVALTRPPYSFIEPSRRWVRSQAGWDWVELAASHLAPVTAPEEVARLLAAFG
ncbi:alpha/beta fold hydrolase [Siccirubricoccus sp. G192]|uniref:alpha/beta fold hydrolase n=1 Tax=Siccirubricoccus sp. G192 TaxID=2849651 RepID=UPI001C2BC4D6|nr:alpha/beta hydrolase [Siccirubricoccus sp. G192]MBV1800317.1 alpha/beta hydrolase [Siccirubricoccus sp. G192]MBV1800540.1 alpha/beta hydrolase [Siccirubricoccus sp. G192]